MTKQQFALDYSKCTTAELKQFIRSRTGQTVTSARRSAHYQALEDADNAVTFRFFDLSPELRNLVYTELLTPVEGKSRSGDPVLRCHPAILRTCRQAQQEGDGILYMDVELRLTLSMFIRDHRRLTGAEFAIRYKEGLYELPGAVHVAKRQNVEARFYEVPGAWTAFLLKTPALKIRIFARDYRTGWQDPSLWNFRTFAEINHYLYSLASYLGAANDRRLKTLEVAFVRDLQDTYMDEMLAQTPGLHMLLWSLLKIGKLNKVIFDNDISDLVQEALHRETDRATRNLVEESDCVQREADRAAELMDKLPKSNVRDSIMRSLDALQSATDFTTCMTDIKEIILKKRVRKLRKLLTSEDVSGVENLAYDRGRAI